MKTIDLSQVKNYVETKVTETSVKAQKEYDVSSYGPKIMFAPEGFKFTGEFRKPVKGEYFLSCDLSARQEPTQAIRLILKPVTKKKVYIFTETGEVRYPYPGDYFKDGKNFFLASYHYALVKYPIYKVEVKEIEE